MDSIFCEYCRKSDIMKKNKKTFFSLADVWFYISEKEHTKNDENAN